MALKFDNKEESLTLNQELQVRSLFSMIKVLNTALVPVVIGLLLDKGVTVSQIALGCAAGLTAVTCNSFRIKTEAPINN